MRKRDFDKQLQLQIDEADKALQSSVATVRAAEYDVQQARKVLDALLELRQRTKGPTKPRKPRTVVAAASQNPS